MQKISGAESCKSKPNYAHVRHLNQRPVSVSRQDVAPYPSEANYSNEEDLSKRSSDDTKNEGCDQVLIEENCNNLEEKDVPRRSPRTNKGVSPLRNVFKTHPFNT